MSERIQDEESGRFLLKYDAERHPDMARKFALLGCKDERNAEFLGISRSTFALWRNQYPEFDEAVRQGKDEADANVASALYHAAIGYSHQSVVHHVINNELVETPVLKQYPPDTRAGARWLSLRQKGQWKETQTVEINTSDDMLARMAAAEARVAARGDEQDADEP